MVQTVVRAAAIGRPRWSWVVSAGWGLLLALGSFFLIAPISDLLADARVGIPGDHVQEFARLAGVSWAATAGHGVGAYVTRLEVAYAMHELVFGVLFLAIVAIPLRRGEQWAWWACWVVLLASVTYALTFGGPYSGVAVIAVPVLLLSQLPRIRSGVGRR